MKSSLNKYFSNLDGVLISSPANIVYFVGNFGFSEFERECLLLITKNRKFLITDKRYSEAVKNNVKNFKVLEIPAGRFLKESSQIIKNLKIKNLGFEENNLTFLEHSLLKKSVKLTPLNLIDLRALKSKNEIENIKLACKIADQSYKFILVKLKAGVPEQQIANELEFFIKKNRADISFKPIVAFGKNSAIPHHLSDRTKLKQNQIVLLDFGVKINNYCSDMTRTIFFGSAPAEFKRIYQTVLDAQTKAIEYINSQLFAKDIDKIARDYIIKQGFPNIIHSVGHGIGIEVHEAPHLSPMSKDIIKPGMVFSVEPGIYITGYGGVRIEDLVVVTKKGAELISHANREIIEV